MSQREIARRAGCGVGTVNRVLGGSTGVAPALRARILSIAAGIGYAPPRVRVPAPDLRRRTVILLLRRGLQNKQDPIVDDFIIGLGEEAAVRGLTLAPVTCPAPHPGLLSGQPTALPGLREGNHLGAVLWGWGVPEEVRWLAASVPCVVVGNLMHLHEPWCTININHFAGTNLMLERLLELGHRRIGFLHTRSLGFRAHERLGAFIQALASEGLEEGPHEVLHLGEPEDCSVRLPARVAAGVSAWIADCHATGLAAQAALAAAGIPVPDQVSLVSFLAKAHPSGRPALAGVRGPFRAMGRCALRALLEPRAPWEPGHRILMDVELEPGATLGPPG